MDGDLTQLRDLLIEIKTKMDVLVLQHTDHEVRIRAVEQRAPGDPSVAAQVQDHETRIRGIERSKWILTGAAAVIGGIAGNLAGLL